MRRPIVLGVLAAMTVALLALPVARAAEQREPPGRRLYLRYCSACHGPDAKGDGIVAPLMRPAMPDLTAIATHHGGEFPLAEIVKTLDGREMPHAHGEPAMPVWGTVLAEELGSRGTQRPAIERRVQSRILTIAEYLRTIQEK